MVAFIVGGFLSFARESSYSELRDNIEVNDLTNPSHPYSHHVQTNQNCCFWWVGVQYFYFPP